MLRLEALHLLTSPRKQQQHMARTFILAWTSRALSSQRTFDTATAQANRLPAAFCRCAAQVRITSQGKSRSYISYGTSLLTEKGHTSVVLKAMGKAINKTVTIGAALVSHVMCPHLSTLRAPGNLLVPIPAML